MATTTFSTNSDLTKKVWDEKLFRDVEKESYFNKFMGNSAESLVHVKTQLEKEQGDRIRIALRLRLSGSGVTGGQILENNEEAISAYYHDVTLEQYRHAVRFKRGIDEQRVMFKIDAEARDAIKSWGSEKIDQLCFDALFDASPSKTFYLDNTGAFSANATYSTAKAALHATNSKLTPNFVMALKTWAETGGARSGGQSPVRPIKIKGKNHYVLLAHPDALYDLRTNTNYQAFVREAAERGSENPLFTGSVAIIDGVVIHAHENVPIGTDAGGASVAFSQAALMGAQSLVWAWGRRPKTVMKEFDYDNELGVAFDMICAASRPEFNSKDFGSMRVLLSRSNVSGT